MKKRHWLLAAAIITLSACTGQVAVPPEGRSLAGREVTEVPGAIVYPDDNPSIADGKPVYEKMHCAQCHGATGDGVVHGARFGSFSLSDGTWANRQEPVKEYAFLTYGFPGVKHPILRDSLSRRERWNLVFYVRSLSAPLLSDAEWQTVDSVWGSNCAVCHGKRGNGDGPLNKNMEPVPANFHNFARFYARSDDVLYDHIAHGIKWEGMPDFLGRQDRAKHVKFDPPYIRKLVQYVHAFHSTNKPTVTQ